MLLSEIAKFDVTTRKWAGGINFWKFCIQLHVREIGFRCFSASVLADLTSQSPQNVRFKAE